LALGTGLGTAAETWIDAGKNTCERDDKTQTKNQFMSSQAFHRTPCGRVQETTVWEWLELGNLEFFDPVAREYDRDKFLQQFNQNINKIEEVMWQLNGLASTTEELKEEHLRSASNGDQKADPLLKIISQCGTVVKRRVEPCCQEEKQTEAERITSRKNRGNKNRRLETWLHASARGAGRKDQSKILQTSMAKSTQQQNLVPMTFTSLEGSTKVQTWFLSKFFNSSCMALTQLESKRACPISRGSKRATKSEFEKQEIWADLEERVTLSFRLPMICWGGCAFWMWEGALGSETISPSTHDASTAAVRR
jgi:hypothetical protein